MDGKPQLLKSIDDPNGLTEDDWIHCVVPLLHQNDVLWTKITNFNGRYFIPEEQKERVKLMIETSGMQIRIPDSQEKAMVLPDYEAKNRSSARVYCNRGRSAYYRGDYDSAIKDLNTAFTLDPDAKCHAGISALDYLDMIARTKAQSQTQLHTSLRCGNCGGPYHPATGHAFSDTVVACGPCAGRFWAWKLQVKCGWRPITSKAKKRKAAKDRRRLMRDGRRLVRELACAYNEDKNVYPWPDGA